jgi:hypothetical protein
VAVKSKGRKQQNTDLVLTLMIKFGQATTNKEPQQKIQVSKHVINMENKARPL